MDCLSGASRVWLPSVLLSSVLLSCSEDGSSSAGSPAEKGSAAVGGESRDTDRGSPPDDSGLDAFEGPPTLVHLAAGSVDPAVQSAAPPDSARQRLEWNFDEPRPEWITLSPADVPYAAVIESEQLDDALRLQLNNPGSFRVGGLAIDLDGLRFRDWETVIVKVRSHDRFAGVTVTPNPGEEGLPSPFLFFTSPDLAPPVFNDGSIQSYAIPLRSRADEPPEELNSLAVLFGAPGPAAADVLAVTLVPRGAVYLEDWGRRRVVRDGLVLDSLFAHVPARFEYAMEGGERLDLALSVNPGETVTYRVRAGADAEVLFEETFNDAEQWQQRSIPLPGGAFDLVLEAESDDPGAVALWGAPIVSRPRTDDQPDVIFYVIDGGDADLMSLYGYDRSTTPFMEELASEGVLFTRAYSNSTWTQPSTVSFMTGLHHSVLGGLRRGIHSTSVPEAAVTMAEHFRDAGYQTASFTANPNAGRIIGTDRGVDVMRDTETEHHSTSSVDLHELYFQLCEDYPGGPSWVHFQTTDVHEPNEPHDDFAGRYVSKQQREQLDQWDGRIWQVAGQHFGTTSVQGYYDMAIEKAGIDRQEYFGTRRGLYDETMNHQDHSLEEFVARLKKEGRWENTIFVIGSDHGHPAGTFARFGRGEMDPQPEPWQGALCDAYATRIPFMILWPGRIEGGQVIDQPVSMIDVLPTLLDLAGLPPAEVCQGQSLAPLLRGEEQDLAPVILDEFRVDEATGEMIGNLEIIQGRWGASLEIAPVAADGDPALGRHSAPAGGRWGAVHPYFADVPRLLLYDLQEDPFATRAVNDDNPQLVERFTELLMQQWEAHRALSTRFGEGEDVVMTPEQLEQLRALGYIR